MSKAAVALAESLTAASLAGHVDRLAADSMRGSIGAPGRGPVDRTMSDSTLERTAQYLAAQFQALGLEPGGDSGTWLQRYPASGDLVLDGTKSTFLFVGRALSHGKAVLTETRRDVVRQAQINAAADLVFASDTVLAFGMPGAAGGGQAQAANWELRGPPSLLIAGPHTPASLRQVDVRDHVVLYVPPVGADSATREQMIRLLRGSTNVVVISDEDSTRFAVRQAAAQRRPPVVPGLVVAAEPRRWAVYVRGAVVQDALATAGLDLAEARASRVPIAREVPTWIVLDAGGSPAAGAATAPNVVGLVRDPTAPNEAGLVVFTARIPSRLGNPAAQRAAAAGDVAAADVAGLLELARVFAAWRREGERLHRSIVFAAVSGTTGRFEGNAALVDQLGRQQPTGTPILNLHLQGLGCRAGDSLQVRGLQEVRLPTPLPWLAAQHPELGLHLVDGGPVTTPEVAPFPFVRKALPSLSLSPGCIKDPAGLVAGDSAAHASVAALDAEGAARRLRLLFYLGLDVSNTGAFPRWTSEGRQHLQRLP